MDKEPETLLEIIKILRAPGGCPWDREQTRESVSRCMAEECAEVLDAIDHNDPEHICEELGDLLMNVVFQAVIAEEKGEFTLEDVERMIKEKMIRRHAHVFGDSHAENSGEVLLLWDKVKKQEKMSKKVTEESIFSSVTPTLCALDYAEKIQKKAAKYGFDWQNADDIVAKIEEELSELKQAMKSQSEVEVDEELGDLLFAVTNLARFRKRKNSELLLRQTNLKFIRRFNYIEKKLKSLNVKLEDAGIDLLEKYWNEAKKL